MVASTSRSIEPALDFEGLFTKFVDNVQRFPAIGQVLADDLGVTLESIMALPVGFWPAHESFVTAERDHKGAIIGLTERFLHTGRKLAVKGSKRGLIYRPDNFLNNSAHRKNEFIRTEKVGVTCPICGKKSGCLISDDDVDDPSCVICPHESEGSVETRKTGYLHRRHIRIPQSSARPGTPGPASSILLVEGASDTMAGMDLGYRVIGKPSAGDGNSFLTKMCAGQDVILVADNDPAGRDGAEATLQALRPVCRSVVQLFPPQDRGKDLRAWKPTHEEFEQHVASTGVKSDDSKLLETDDPRTLALDWLRDTHMRSGRRTLHRVYNGWYRWMGECYRQLAPEILREELGDFFHGREARIIKRNGDRSIASIKANRFFVEELCYILENRCYVPVEPHTHEPFLIKTGKSMDLTRAVVFQNGIYRPTEDTLTPLTPDVFLTSTLPFNYNPRYRCERLLGTVHDCFAADQGSIDLLQEWCGYLLVADNSFEALMFMIGYPGAGKGTILTAIQAMLGPERFTSMRFIDLRDTHGTAKLFGRYLAVFSEDDVNDLSRTEAGRILAALKGISGNDSSVINEKFERSFSTQLFSRIIYSANELPIFSDASRSLARRLHVLKFPNAVEKPNTSLKFEIQREAPGIAVWAIEGLKRLLANGRFTRPAASEEFLQAVTEDSSPLGSEFDSFLQFASDVSVEKEHLYSLHVTMAKVENIPILARNKFFEKFRSRYPKCIPGKPMDPDTGRRLRTVRGVAITKEGLAYLQQHGC